MPGIYHQKPWLKPGTKKKKKFRNVAGAKSGEQLPGIFPHYPWFKRGTKKKKTVNVGIYLAAGCKTWTAAEEKSNLCGDCEI